MWYDDEQTPDGEDPWYVHVGSKLPPLPAERNPEALRDVRPIPGQEE